MHFLTWIFFNKLAFGRGTNDTISVVLSAAGAILIYESLGISTLFYAWVGLVGVFWFLAALALANKWYTEWKQVHTR